MIHLDAQENSLVNFANHHLQLSVDPTRAEFDKLVTARLPCEPRWHLSTEPGVGEFVTSRQVAKRPRNADSTEYGVLHESLEPRSISRPY